MPSTTSCQAWEAMKREVFLVTNQATAGTQRGANIPATWIAAAILRSCWVVSGPLGWSAMFACGLDGTKVNRVAIICHSTYPHHPSPLLSLPQGMEMRGIAPRRVLGIGKLGR